jgi:hypothetical protein
MALATPRIHHDALDWVRRVVANGGSCSQSTLRAVSAFCDSIDRAGIRDRFYRVNLFCGNSDASLAAVRTPLFRGQSLTGTQFGNTIDTNANFVAADYAENNGLLGNGTTKHLATGLAQTYAGSNEIHQCVGFVPNTAAGYQCMIGARYNVTNSVAHEVRGANANLRVAAFSGGNATGAYTPADGRNLFLLNASNPAAKSYDTWVRGVLFDTRTLGAYNAATSANFLVFAGDTNGTPSSYFSGRADLYSIGLRFTSTAQIDAYHAAIAAFRTAMGRT